MKKLFFIFICVFLSGVISPVFAQEVDLHFFYSETCPHCAQENIFLNGLEEKYPDIKIERYQIYDEGNWNLLNTFYNEYEIVESLRGLVPVTFSPTRYFIGFNDNIAEEMENCLQDCMKPNGGEAALGSTSFIDKNINIPFFGNIKINNFSYPAMAIILGLLDGFNVCSLGALILILSLVLAIKSKRKTLLLGGAFILTTALVYGILIVFWYKLFEILSSYVKTMEILIGTMGIVGGIYFLRQFLNLRKKSPTCDSGTGNSIASKFSNKIQGVLKNPSSNIFIVVGLIFVFAFLITIVEFPCSAVVPVAFAAVLADAGLSGFQYIFYISIFVLFYLLDEIIVFLIAFFTSKIWLSSPKFIKWILLAESIVLFLLGVYYLFGILGL